VTGTGLDAALADADAVVDTTNVASSRARTSREFFEATSRTLTSAAEQAGVRHLVALSIIGIDRVPFGYFQGKLRQEEVLRESRVPVSILRVAQFHELPAQYLARWSGPLVVVPRWRIQPVAAREVGAALARLATGAPVPMSELAGPREELMADLLRQVIRASGVRRRVVDVRLPGAAGRAMASGGNLPSARAARGTQTFAEWLAARKRLLDMEKKATRERDALNAERRRLPMVRIDKEYRLDGPDGQVSLAGLFGDSRQLIVQHVMFGPDWDAACPGCTAGIDELSDGILTHLRSRDTAFVLVSRAPRDKLEKYGAAKGWTVPWYSSYGSDFNYDFQATADRDRQPVIYNYREEPDLLGDNASTEVPGSAASCATAIRSSTPTPPGRGARTPSAAPIRCSTSRRSDGKRSGRSPRAGRRGCTAPTRPSPTDTRGPGPAHSLGPEPEPADSAGGERKNVSGSAVMPLRRSRNRQVT
jgi:predicted dithiol-disulfide oxidoreductase (DUF899 family)